METRLLEVAVVAVLTVMEALDCNQPQLLEALEIRVATGPLPVMTVVVAVLEVQAGFLLAVLDEVPKFQAAEGFMPCSPLVGMAIPQALPQPFPPL
jgi:hypothetical protein